MGASFQKELSGFDGERVVFLHCAGAVDPLGFAAEVNSDAYVETSSSTAPPPRSSATCSSPRPAKSRPSD